MYRSISRVASAFAILLLAACCGCHSNSAVAKSDQPDQAASKPATRSESGSSRDLSADESSGGHTLKRHVGRTDDQLHDRLNHERISAASTYTDRATAEQAIGSAIAANQGKIQSWVSRSGGHPNLVLDYDSPRPIGRTLYRDERRSAPCSHALVVLKWKPPADYYVLTSYPECKP